MGKNAQKRRNFHGKGQMIAEMELKKIYGRPPIIRLNRLTLAIRAVLRERIA